MALILKKSSQFATEPLNVGDGKLSLVDVISQTEGDATHRFEPGDIVFIPPKAGWSSVGAPQVMANSLTSRIRTGAHANCCTLLPRSAMDAVL